MIFIVQALIISSIHRQSLQTCPPNKIKRRSQRFLLLFHPRHRRMHWKTTPTSPVLEVLWPQHTKWHVFHTSWTGWFLLRYCLLLGKPLHKSSFQRFLHTWRMKGRLKSLLAWKINPSLRSEKLRLWSYQKRKLGNKSEIKFSHLHHTTSFRLGNFFRNTELNQFCTRRICKDSHEKWNLWLQSAHFLIWP